MSGVTVPPTMLSPSPQLAVMTISSVSPLTGLALKSDRRDIGDDELLDQHDDAGILDRRAESLGRR